MILIPAIDLYQGKVVRFVRGNPKEAVVYSDKPINIAKKWQDEGAQMLHLVDLSSALGEGDSLDIINNILKKTEIKIQIGGGIRDLDKAERLLSLGAHRIIVGTKGLDEDFLNNLIENIDKEKIAVSVDVFGSHLAIEGWKKKVDFEGLDYIAYLKFKGIKWIIYTDISRDGTLEGIDLKEIKKLSDFKDMNIIFSGGISSLGDIKKIKEEAPFIWGLISGKALYEGTLKFKEAKDYLDVDKR